MHIVGHIEAQEILSATDKSRSHSFLIEGAKGIGKCGLAYKFAGEILGSFDRVKNGSHPDFLLIERRLDEKEGTRKKEIVVDDARKLREFLSYTPAEGEHRVAIIDSADELNNNAANAILKAVEEPPRKAIIIILSHGGYVLPTIRSRCVAVKLKPLNNKQMKEVLDGLLPEMPKADMELLLKLAEGSPGSALNIVENGGLEIAHKLSGIISGFPKFNYLDIADFAKDVTKSSDVFEIFKLIFDWLLLQLAKKKIAVNISDFGNFLSLSEQWTEAALEAEIYNLDNRGLVEDYLLKLAKA